MSPPEPSASSVIRAKNNAVGGGTKRCTKGKNCSATCIASNEICLVELPTPSQEALKKVVGFVKSQPQSTEKTLSSLESKSEQSLWTSAAEGDMSRVNKETKKWVKAHGFDELQPGHDSNHVIAHSFFKVDSDYLASLTGNKKGEIGLAEEGLVNYLEQLARARMLAKSATPEEIQRYHSEWQKHKEYTDPNSFAFGTVSPKLANAPIPKEEIKRHVLSNMEDLGLHFGVRRNDKLSSAAEKIADMVYDAQTKPGFYDMVDTLPKISEAQGAEFF